MGPWQSFIVEMTKVALAWPAVALWIFLICVRKRAQVRDLINLIANRFRRLVVSKEGILYRDRRD